MLFAPQHQQLGVGGEDLAQSVLKGAAGFDAPADVVHPIFGNAFDPFLAGGHEGQRPSGVPLALGAMAGGFTAAGMADGERARKQILGKLELAEQRKFALAEPGSLGTLGLEFHLEVILLQEVAQTKPNSRTRK